MSIEIHLMGVKTRQANIDILKQDLALTEDQIIYDDREVGGDALYTAIKAWESLLNSEATHVMVIQDDAEVCNNFKTYAEQIITNFPDKAFSLFPFDYQHYTDISKESPYYETRICSAVALVLPKKYLKDYVDFLKQQTEEKNDSTLFRLFCKDNNIQILTVLPALVQHLGDYSLVYGNAIVRKIESFNKDIPEWVNFNSKIINPIPKSEFSCWVDEQVKKSVNIVKSWVK